MIEAPANWFQRAFLLLAGFGTYWSSRLTLERGSFPRAWAFLGQNSSVPTTPAGSLILSTIMVGALWAHAANGEWPHLVPAAVLLTLFLTIFRVNRARALHLLGGG